MPTRVSTLLHALRYNGLFWRRFAYLGSVYGPEWWKRYSPPGIALVIFLIAGDNRRGAAANLARVLPEPYRRHPWRAALRMFAEFAYCFSEALEHYSPHPRPLRLDLPERDLLAQALGEGRGVVLVTGHFGNWDIAAKTLCDYGRPIHIVTAHDVNVTTREDIRAARERAGVRMIYSDSSVFSSLNMIRALRQNEIVAIQLDRMLGAGGARLVPFFGRPARFPSGPFVLARLAGAPIVPAFVPRLGRRHYAIRLGGTFRVPREARDPASLDRIMGEVVAVFEETIREFPTQWFQFTPFWPEQEPAEAGDTRSAVVPELPRSTPIARKVSQ